MMRPLLRRIMERLNLSTAPNLPANCPRPFSGSRLAKHPLGFLGSAEMENYGNRPQLAIGLMRKFHQVKLLHVRTNCFCSIFLLSMARASEESHDEPGR
jgi:hypothetical protein